MLMYNTTKNDNNTDVTSNYEDYALRSEPDWFIAFFLFYTNANISVEQSPIKSHPICKHTISVIYIGRRLLSQLFPSTCMIMTEDCLLHFDPRHDHSVN
jgi:hypothetical protein